MHKIEDYGLIGDTQTAALVSRSGSIDWLCLPRFDSGACFAALLGTERHGCYRIAPPGAPPATRRRYRPNSLILETEFETDEGAVRLIDFMKPRNRAPRLVRIVEGLRGRVRLRLDLVVRFDYGLALPWVMKTDAGLEAKAGPDALVLRTPVETRGENLTTVADFTVAAGERVPFELSWFPSADKPPPPLDPERALAATEEGWRRWLSRCRYEGEWAEPVRRSLMVLKAMTYAPTGGIVAAPTTSLPEELGGSRNWDYRFCWLRDAALTLGALHGAGYTAEAVAWRDWLLRAAAGNPADLQPLYGPSGERRIPEFEVAHLPGYEGSRPVRVGNAASQQFQLDIYGEVVDSLYRARATSAGAEHERESWSLQQKLIEYVEAHWHEPDHGIWELRDRPRHLTYSKAMAWVAVERTVRAAEEFGLPCEQLPRWRALAGRIRADVLARGYDSARGAFTQSYGSPLLDASVLRLPLVGFLPADDPRMLSTVRAIERELLRDGLVRRYDASTDNLEGDEGVFLPCSFWLADNYTLAGRRGEARALFERLLSLRNDLGLLAEEYDPARRRQLGNFPQAFSHVALVNSAAALAAARARTSRPAPARGSAR